MILWTDNKVILFLADFKFPIEDTVKVQPFFILNNDGVNHQDISLVISSKDSKLFLYIVCDSEEIMKPEKGMEGYSRTKFSVFTCKSILQVRTTLSMHPSLQILIANQNTPS